ncbi:hypothetical protein TWF694_004340 [Orbilia ellipsospora]|uniref:Uncharacterized protein n=1 Tax=Orbilia ellipsospora TaxID=2528407 RepID=A0AAV9WXT9_9PEZI
MTDKRNDEIQAVVLGLPRCATTTVSAMLNSDYLSIRPTMHGFWSAAGGMGPDLILDALRLVGTDDTKRRQSILYEVFSGYAGSGSALQSLATDMMDMYPNAKFILNVRPPPRNGEPPSVAWARSCRQAVGHLTSPWCMITSWPVSRYRFGWKYYRLHTDLWRQKGLLPDKSSSFWVQKGSEWMVPEFYDRYLEWIQHEAKQRGRDVLVWHPGMGWEPICEFFGKESPPKGTPVPSKNPTPDSLLIRNGEIQEGIMRYAAFAVTLYACWWLVLCFL